MTKAITEKVVAYITHGDKLLVFIHPYHPEAGTQVPAGTVEKGERPEEAVLREAREETGLDGLQIRSYLGVQEYDMSALGRPEIQRRHFFHLELCSEPSAGWRYHGELLLEGSDMPPEYYLFEFFWARLPDEVPELIAGQGELLDRLKPT